MSWSMHGGVSVCAAQEVDRAPHFHLARFWVRERDRESAITQAWTRVQVFDMLGPGVASYEGMVGSHHPSFCWFCQAVVGSLPGGRESVVCQLHLVKSILCCYVFCKVVTSSGPGACGSYQVSSSRTFRKTFIQLQGISGSTRRYFPCSCLVNART